VTPSDDKIETTIFVDNVRVSARPPVGNSPPDQFTLDPSALVIRHPVYRELNKTWLQLNDSRPDAARPYVGFESRQTRYCWKGEWVDSDDDRGLFLTLYTSPDVPPGCGAIDAVQYCWDYCSLDNETEMQQSEDEIRPLPNDASLLRSNDGRDFDTDAQVDGWVLAAETCSSADCKNSTSPVLDPLGKQYHDNTPDAAVGFRFNRTTVTVKPDKPPRPPEFALSANMTALLESAAVGSLMLDVISPADDSNAHSFSPEPKPTSRSPVVPPSPPPPKVSSVPPSVPPAQAPGVALLIAAGAATTLLLAAWLLYTRLSRRDVLDQATRRRVHEKIRTSPGLRATDIAPQLGVSRKTIEYHAKRLQTGGVVRAEGLRPRYFPIEQSIQESRVSQVLAQTTPRAVHAALRDRGELDHSQLATALGVSVATIGRAVARLEWAGLASQTRVGNRVLVRLVAPTRDLTSTTTDVKKASSA
jgi:predicted transcriptional regulator